MKFNINFLPANYGDCIWIEYGLHDNIQRILIDGGTSGTKRHIKKRIEELPLDQRHIELIIVTHIDRDHIEGILSLLEEETLNFTIGSIWFNGWHHLPGNEDLEMLGALQGERLSASIIKHRLSWNAHFNGKAVVIPEGGVLPKIKLTGGLEITLLSPSIQNLKNLKPAWENEVKKAYLDPGFGLKLPTDAVEALGIIIPNVEALSKEVFHEDEAVANGSSIAILASYSGKSVLLAGDSFPGLILESLNKITDKELPIDLFKLSHHASAHNTSPDLIHKLICSRYAVSTNGSIYQHPSKTTIARLIKLKGKGSKIFFNYKTDFNEFWGNSSLQKMYQYETVYPENEGIEIQLF